MSPAIVPGPRLITRSRTTEIRGIIFYFFADFSVFTAQCYAERVTAMGKSVCPSICLSMTSGIVITQVVILRK